MAYEREWPAGGNGLRVALGVRLPVAGTGAVATSLRGIKGARAPPTPIAGRGVMDHDRVVGVDWAREPLSSRRCVQDASRDKAAYARAMDSQGLRNSLSDARLKGPAEFLRTAWKMAMTSKFLRRCAPKSSSFR